jgi:hypothetical protein
MRREHDYEVNKYLKGESRGQFQVTYTPGVDLEIMRNIINIIKPLFIIFLFFLVGLD